MLSVRIFRSCVVGHECFFKCWAFVTDSPLMMAQSRAESTRDTYNYGQYLNQFPPNMIKVIREFERIQKRICRQKMSIMLNEICIYIYIYIYIYIDVVHSIRFQLFFVQAFKIVIDSWKFSMILLYILLDDWPIFMISGSNEQLHQ